MNYFKNVKIKDEVYSLIYGKGKVDFILPKVNQIEGFYAFSVQYKKDKVFYTLDGVPNWCQVGGCSQTAFYCKDVDMSKIDFTPNNKILSEKKILKLLESKELEVRCPSGLWRNSSECPEQIIKKYIKKGKYFLFRKEMSE